MHDDDGDTGRNPADVLDHELGKVRILANRCTTCVFRPGNLMHLEDGRLAEIVRRNVNAGALLTCHQTLPYGDHPDADPAVCRGFWDGYGDLTAAGRMAVVIGTAEVDPPGKD